MLEQLLLHTAYIQFWLNSVDENMNICVFEIVKTSLNFSMLQLINKLNQHKQDKNKVYI